jgi:hypothetical protein
MRFMLELLMGNIKSSRPGDAGTAGSVFQSRRHPKT